LFNVIFIAFDVNEGSEYLWGRVGVKFEYVDFDVFIEIVFEKILCEFLDESVHVTEEDQRFGIWKFSVF